MRFHLSFIHKFFHNAMSYSTTTYMMPTRIVAHHPLSLLCFTTHFSSSSQLCALWFTCNRDKINSQVILVPSQANRICWIVSFSMQKQQQSSFKIPILHNFSLVSSLLWQANQSVHVSFDLVGINRKPSGTSETLESMHHQFNGHCVPSRKK